MSNRFTRRALGTAVAVQWLFQIGPAIAQDLESCSVYSCKTEEGYVVRIINHGDSQPASSKGSEEKYAANRRASVTGEFMTRFPEGGTVWATEDPAVLGPRLAVQGPDRLLVRGGRSTASVEFAAYSNYGSFIDSLELLVYRAEDTDRVSPIGTVSVDVDERTQTLWILPWDGVATDGRPLERDRELSYVLRATSADGQVDETTLKRVQLVDNEGAVVDREPNSPADADAQLGLPTGSLAAVYGRSDLAQRNITVSGSRVRVVGEGIAEGYDLAINGEQVPVSVNRESGRRHFASEYLLPVGQHDFDVTMSGGNQVMERTLGVDVTGKYMFMVGMADLTITDQDINGSMEPLAADDKFQEDVLVEGRLAFYLKGKIKGKYLITAQLDSQEEELGDLVSNLDKKDAQSLFRRLDPDRYYAVYGDDSTTIRDTDTLGRMYVRLDWNKSEVLWGNYHTDMTGNEFAQYNRSLYGAKLRYRGPATTELGDSKSQALVFYSEGQTALGHSEFLGTGGSLYYLRHTDILPGSDKAWIEVRDRDSGRVVQNLPLVRGTDYDVDELQGRLILSRPLLQISQQLSPSLIKDQPLDGNEMMLLVDYEYAPVGFDLDHGTVGARGKQWIGEHFAIGGTYVDENRDGGEEYTLKGADLTVQAGRGSYVKMEYAQTEATQTESFFSNDGGLSFSSLTTTAGTPTSPFGGMNRQGDAYGMEARVNFRERGWTKRDSSSAIWWRRTDDGFSVSRRDLGIDTYEYGFEFFGNVTDKLMLGIRGSVVDQEDMLEDQFVGVQGDYRLSDTSSLSAELRQVEHTVGADQSVEASLLGVQYTNHLTSNFEGYVRSQVTLENDDGAYDNNDMVTLGTRYQVGARTMVGTEFSSGHRGSGATLTADHQLNDIHQLYGSYTYYADRTDNLGAPLGNPDLGNNFGRANQLGGDSLTVGHRSRLSHQVNLFNEAQFIERPYEAGMQHVFGMDFAPTPGWAMGMSYQYGELDGINGVIDRDAYSLRGGYRNANTVWTSKVEYRNDSGMEEINQWLTTNHVSHKFNESWRILGRMNYADSDGASLQTFDAKFVEGVMGFAYRPAANDRLNLLGKYTFLYDLQSFAQEDAGTDQRSHIVAVEGIYRLTPKWEVGGKLAQRSGELRTDRSSGQWFDSTTGFAAMRWRYHLIKRWDALAEYRWLDVDEAQSTRQGWLVGLDRHITDYLKLGVGYNFTDFSDDLTQLDYEYEGWFVNAVGKY